VIAIFQLVVLLFSVIVHEVSHGLAALKLGDDTAKRLGRLTLNPIPHLDPFGSLILPALLFLTSSPFMIGWAKPVPYNPGRLYKDFKYGPLKVALAGPASNLILAIIFAIPARLLVGVLDPVLIGFMGIVVFINVLLALFNLVPIPPLDGSNILTILLPEKYSNMIQSVGIWGIFIVIFLLSMFSRVLFSGVLNLSAIMAGEDVIIQAFRILS